mmetsp:Transcript_980/g.1767  ORF Transcript_980/g.1767 Transcript_980/m.1767 type:complete len:289 (+) Transcript_980:105-971(+)
MVLPSNYTGSFECAVNGTNCLMPYRLDAVLIPLSLDYNDYSTYFEYGLSSFFVLLTGWVACCCFIEGLSKLDFVKKSKIQALEKSHDPALLALARKTVVRNWIFVLTQTFVFAPVLERCFPLSSEYLDFPNFALFILAWLVTNDFLFTLAHKAYHENPVLYQVVHKEHHTWKAPHVWMSHAMTFTEMMVNGFAVMFFPLFHSVVLNRPTHLHLVWFVQLVSQAIGCVEHSGYDALNPLFFVSPNWFGGYVFASTKHHDDHHKYFKGNYGGYFAFWDILFGTTLKVKGA